MGHFSPNKPVAETDHKAVVRSMISAAGGPKTVAERLGRRKSQIYNYCDPDSTQEIPFSAVCLLAQAGVLDPVHHLCAQAGGQFIPGKASPLPIAALMSAAVKESAEATACFIEAQSHASAMQTLVLVREITEAVDALLQAKTKILSAVERA